MVIRHLLNKVSCIYAVLLKQSGSMYCTVAGKWSHMECNSAIFALPYTSVTILHCSNLFIADSFRWFNFSGRGDSRKV